MAGFMRGLLRSILFIQLAAMVSMACFILPAACNRASERGGPKIFMITDMEGVAGVFNFEDWTYEDGRFHAEARRLATMEINAAVQGALDGGASEVVVLDGHGVGSINAGELHPEALLVGGGGYDFTTLIDSSFDAACMVGQHAMIHAPGGNMDHSWSSRTINGAWLNGKPVGEIGVNAILAGYFGVPMIFLSGDTAACNELKALAPDAVTIPVKEGISRASAKSLSPVKSREAIRNGMKEAVRNLSRVKPYFVKPPYILRYTYHEIVKQGRHNLPQYEKILPGDKVIEADDFLELLRKR